MRTVLLSLAAMAALLPSAALALDQDAERLAEMRCAYDRLDGRQRMLVAETILGSPSEVETAEEEAEEAAGLALFACEDLYGWSGERTNAASEYMLSLVIQAVMVENLPLERDPATLDAVMAGWPADVQADFTYQGQLALDDYDAWYQGVSVRLAQAGIPEEEHRAAVYYLAAQADLDFSTRTWDDLFASGTR